MERVVPWPALVGLIAPHAPAAKTGRPPFALETMLRIHFMQQWVGLSDMVIEEAPFDVAMYREFAGLSGAQRVPDRVSILRFRHVLEHHQLAEQILQIVNEQLAARGFVLKEGKVDATFIAAPYSTKNKDGQRDPEMRQTRKGNRWNFGMEAHIRVDADSGLFHTVMGTAANVNDVTRVHAPVHGDERDVFGCVSYQGVEKRDETQDIKANWRVAMRPSKRRTLDKDTPMGKVLDEFERVKACIRTRRNTRFESSGTCSATSRCAIVD